MTLYKRIIAALTASKLVEKYKDKFKECKLDDSVVEECIENSDFEKDLSRVIPLKVHRDMFKSKFRKIMKSIKPPDCPKKDVQPVKQVVSEAVNKISTTTSTTATTTTNHDNIPSTSHSFNSPSNSSSSSSPHTTTSRDEPKDLVTYLKELYDQALKLYENSINQIMTSSSEVFFHAESSLVKKHEECKYKANEHFLRSYDTFTNNLNKIKMKAEEGKWAILNVKLDSTALNLKIEELDNAMDKYFESIKEKNQLRQSNFIAAAKNVLLEAEKSYVSQMNQLSKSCTSESELREMGEKVNQKMINYLNNNINNTSANPVFITELNRDLIEFMNNSFNDNILKTFQLKRTEHELIYSKAVTTAKRNYKEEMDKYFISKDFHQPSDLNQFHERMLKKTLKMITNNTNLNLSSDEISQITETLNFMYKNYEEQNLLKIPTSDVSIGIDLGTTYSCVAVYLNGKAQVIPNDKGKMTTPSYVAVQDDGTFLCGSDAKQDQTRPENIIFDSKRLIGRNFNDPTVQEHIKSWPFSVINVDGKPKIEVKLKPEEDEEEHLPPVFKKRKLAQNSSPMQHKNKDADSNSNVKTFWPEEISAQVLKKMKTIAEDYLGCEVKNAVITVPAMFSDSQRQATKDAGEIAGLNVMRILNEPTAAAICYRLDRKDETKRNVLIFDLGGGTFDVAVLEIVKGDIKVKSVHGDSVLGGQDFDNEMIKYCMNYFKKEYGVDLTVAENDPRLLKDRFYANVCLRKIRNECEKQKKILSTANKVAVHVYTPHPSYKHLDLNVPFTRELFESLNQKYFDRCIDIVRRALHEANMTKLDIDDVVLVGGSTRIPMVQKKLSDYFEGKTLCKTVKQDEAVALGAAIHASILNGKQAADLKDFNLILNDVTPFSLGIRAEGRCIPLIPKNANVPIEHRTRKFSIKEGENCTRIFVLEGESAVANENNLLGQFDILLPHVSPTKHSQENLELTMKVNEEGILHVKAVCVSNEQYNNEITIKAIQGRLSRQDIERARESA